MYACMCMSVGLTVDRYACMRQSVPVAVPVVSTAAAMAVRVPVACIQLPLDVLRDGRRSCFGRRLLSGHKLTHNVCKHLWLLFCWKAEAGIVPPNVLL